MALVAFVGAAVVAWWWIASLGPTPLGEGLSFSTLVVDRDHRKVSANSDQLVVLQKGRVVLAGPSESLRDSERLTSFLGV